MKHSVGGMRGFLCFVLVLAWTHEASGASGAGVDVEKRRAGMQLHEGEVVYRRHCMVCHALVPPPKAAPPVKGLALHYREAFPERQEAVGHMVAFIKKPDASKAICHKESIVRFGLMPAMNLPDSELRKVSLWIWEQYDPGMKHSAGNEHKH